MSRAALEFGSILTNVNIYSFFCRTGLFTWHKLCLSRAYYSANSRTQRPWFWLYLDLIWWCIVPGHQTIWPHTLSNTRTPTLFPLSSAVNKTCNNALSTKSQHLYCYLNCVFFICPIVFHNEMKSAFTLNCAWRHGNNSKVSDKGCLYNVRRHDNKWTWYNVKFFHNVKLGSDSMPRCPQSARCRIRKRSKLQGRK